MDNPRGLDRCLSFIHLQLNPPGPAGPGGHPPLRRAVTLSRQTGCGALMIAEKLAARLQQSSPAGAPPWTVFDRNLMEAVLADHNLPARIARFLPEDRMTELQDIVDELFGLRPASWTMIQQTSETILRLAELGNAILIGRGATVITAKRPHVVHVRLVAPLATRIEHIAQAHGLSQRAARDFCRREDLGRRRYLRKYFKADIDDPLLYHLCVNTGVVTIDDAARLIAEMVHGLASRATSAISRSGMTDASAACAHRAELQYTQLERL